MKQKEVNIVNGSLFKNILIFSIPLMLSNLLQVLFNMSDIAVVGKFGSNTSLGSVGSTVTLVTLFTGFLIGLGSGVNVLVAKYIGSQNKEGTKKTLGTSLIVCLILGTILALLGFIFANGFLKLLKTKDDLIDGATLYLRIYFWGMPAVALYNYGSSSFSAMGNTKKPLIFLFISGILNVLLNLFFVIVCKMDVAGVALASIISQYLSAFLVVFSLFKIKSDNKLEISYIKIDKSKAMELLKLGLPAGFQNSIFAIANLFIQSGVNSFDTIMVSGNSAAANADSIVYDVMAAVYIACATFISQNYAANKKERIIPSYLISMLYSFLFGLVLGLSILLLGEQFLGLFTTSQEVIDAGMKRLQILCYSYAFSALMDNTIAASRGLGKTVVPTIIVISGSCIFRIIWVYTIFAYFKTIPALYLIYIVSWTITGVAELIYFIYTYKKKVKLNTIK